MTPFDPMVCDAQEKVWKIESLLITDYRQWWVQNDENTSHGPLVMAS